MTGDIKAKAYNVRGKLRAMKESIEADEANSTIQTVAVTAPDLQGKVQLLGIGASFQGSMAQMRIRKLQHSILQQDFVEMMTDYNKQQMDYHDRHRDHIRKVSCIFMSRAEPIESLLRNNCFISHRKTIAYL